MPEAAPFTIAAVQAAPVFLDRQATLEKACALIAEAGAAGARLAVFPEAFLPTYPFWVWSVPAGDTATLRALYAELLDQSVAVPGPETERLGAAARAAGVAVAIGINERNAEASGSTLYNSLLFL
ncbi:MAG TPA: nitrilase-related carbon-nitrogen hydrolase, partial [Thermoanaerobaculia bacterium]